MKYEDFPILQNEQYNLINEQFANRKYNRKTITTLLSNQISCCLNSFRIAETNYNKKISTALVETQTILNKQINNLSSLFNIQIQNHTFKETNIFIALKKLTAIITTYNNWSEQEEKEYYKKLAIKSSNELLQQLTKILSTMAESEFCFFKHM